MEAVRCPLSRGAKKVGKILWRHRGIPQKRWIYFFEKCFQKFFYNFSNFFKLDNFKGGVIKSVMPANLDRAEDFFVHATRADTMGLNRYKVLA